MVLFTHDARTYCKGPFRSSDCDFAATLLQNLNYCFGVVLLHWVFVTATVTYYAAHGCGITLWPIWEQRRRDVADASLSLDVNGTFWWDVTVTDRPSANWTHRNNVWSLAHWTFSVPEKTRQDVWRGGLGGVCPGYSDEISDKVHLKSTWYSKTAMRFPAVRASLFSFHLLNHKLYRQEISLILCNSTLNLFIKVTCCWCQWSWLAWFDTDTLLGWHAPTVCTSRNTGRWMNKA